LREYGYQREIPLENAKRLFFEIVGAGDRATIKAYFGSQAGKSIKRIQKIARYSTGTMSFKNIELAQEVPERKGYFEVLGLAKFERKPNGVWFMVLTEPSLVPELVLQHYEGSEKLPNRELSSMEDFSLSLIAQRESEALGNDCSSKESNKQTTTYSGRERNLELSNSELSNSMENSMPKTSQELSNSEKSYLTQLSNSREELSNKCKGKKVCPKCHAFGYGPYKRYVLNARKKRFEPYFYFCHKNGKTIKWCYLGKLPNKANAYDSRRRAIASKKQMWIEEAEKIFHAVPLEKDLDLAREKCPKIKWG
jgi:hypothetical protein